MEPLRSSNSAVKKPLGSKKPIGDGRNEVVSPSRQSFAGSGGQNVDPNIGRLSPRLGGRSRKTPLRCNTCFNSVNSKTVDDTSLSSSVKVVVRIRPPNSKNGEEARALKDVCPDSLKLGDRNFSFDSVLGSESSQEDVFKEIGVPFVRNALCGFNTSLVSYGHTGSGKTYTMWGPSTSMVSSHSVNAQQGITPRLFHMLFSEIKKMQEHAEGKEINCQCRCSFLEVHNEQINDLINPNQRNLQIKDDSRNGLYVENLTQEYVSSVEEAIQILVKGLLNRKVGATSVNTKSSRSHIIFSCMIETWRKIPSQEVHIKQSGNLKTSRISLVDLAGSDKDLHKEEGRRTQNERHVMKSLSKLGRLMNLLTRDGEEVPSYSDSCLTHLLKETLGGNAKVTLLCTISPESRYRAASSSTLRFGQRAKRLRNVAVINEIKEDDVNGLTDQIRKLKEELIRAKSRESLKCFAEARHRGEEEESGHFQGRRARESLNKLRVSLNRSLILPRLIVEDGNDECEGKPQVSEVENAEELCAQLEALSTSILKEEEEENSEHCGEKTMSEGAGEARGEEEAENCDDRENRRLEELSIISCSSLPGHDDDDDDNEDVDGGSQEEDYKGGLSPTDSLAASLHRGLQIIDYHERRSATRPLQVCLSLDHFAAFSSSLNKLEKNDAGIQTSPDRHSDGGNREKEEALLGEIQSLKDQLMVMENEKYKILLAGADVASVGTEEVEQRWTESESRWICLTEELRQELESMRRRAEKTERELGAEKESSAELGDALHRAIIGHARMVEHFVELQERHEGLAETHRRIMQGISVVQAAASRARSNNSKWRRCGGGGGGPAAFAEALTAELSSQRAERERERVYLKAQNKELKLQLRDTTEAVQAAGELLVRLRESEQAASASEEKLDLSRRENERLQRQMEKMKKKHAMEMETVKHYMAESRLPDSALEPLYRQGTAKGSVAAEDGDGSWANAFSSVFH